MIQGWLLNSNSVEVGTITSVSHFKAHLSPLAYQWWGWFNNWVFYFLDKTLEQRDMFKMRLLIGYHLIAVLKLILISIREERVSDKKIEYIENVFKYWKRNKRIRFRSF